MAAHVTSHHTVVIIGKISEQHSRITLDTFSEWWRSWLWMDTWYVSEYFAASKLTAMDSFLCPLSTDIAVFALGFHVVPETTKQAEYNEQRDEGSGYSI